MHIACPQLEHFVALKSVLGLSASHAHLSGVSEADEPEDILDELEFLDLLDLSEMIGDVLNAPDVLETACDVLGAAFDVVVLEFIEMARTASPELETVVVAEVEN